MGMFNQPPTERSAHNSKPEDVGLESYPRTFAEYFAGIGLIRMGLESAGWRVVFANDHSGKKFQMYKDFYPDDWKHYVVDDVFSLRASDVPLATLATCSFPCIDLSLAGNMHGIDGKHSSAFWGFIRILREQQDSAPHMILVENVPGWLSSNSGKDFRITIEALTRLGYACDVFTLDARRFTPQSRPRVFLVGVKYKINDSGYQEIIRRNSSLATPRLKTTVEENRDLNWIHFDIPDPLPLFNSGLAEIVESLSDDDERWWPRDEVKRHLDMMSDDHRARVHALINNNHYSFRTFYRRRRNGEQRAEVRKGDTAGCLRTAVGGSSKQFLIRAGMGKLDMRLMTPREYARLQGVPDSFQIKVSDIDALTGFGDAVCVPAITWIGENVLNPIHENLTIINHPVL